MDTTCSTDLRRQVVRQTAGRNGLDYVEIGDDPLTLRAYFLGKLPPELSADSPDLPRHLAIDGGDVIRDLRIVDVDPLVDPDPTHDDALLIRVDREGDRSRYTLRLVDIEGIDPHYASAGFSFRIDCASDLDCRPACDCASPAADEPRPNYLAKDYETLRQLLLDRLALLVPAWRERHVPDLGLTLVELLAYVGDYLSYQQDAVGTEAYLGTARQRISVRRHARLVDYRLHEGCNARAWVQVGVDVDTPPLAFGQLAFVTPWREDLGERPRLVRPEDLAGVAPSSYEWFEPCVADASQTIVFRAAHHRIGFYTWGQRSCCLAAGSTGATLRDAWRADGSRTLQLAVGDVLVLAELRGPRTGLPADADPTRRWAVRLTEVTPDEDPLFPLAVGGGEFPGTRPTPLVRVRWGREDALPFALCLSAIGSAPECAWLDDVSMALGNIVLVDHGRRQPGETLGPVPWTTGEACCDCVGEPSEVKPRPLPFRPRLAGLPLTHAETPPARTLAAARSLSQDPRNALPALWLGEAEGGARWSAAPDLLDSGPDDRHVVAEIDNEGVARLRFGDGELGRRPPPGGLLQAHYRTGNGTAGNVGANAITFIVVKGQVLDGVTFTPWNPLPAQGGTDAEPIEQARELAPTAFRRTLARAITAADYADIARQDARLQGAQAALVWTGSWYEADVALDPWQRHAEDPSLAPDVQAALYRVRRMGHDLRIRPARRVPVFLSLQACAKPGYERGHLKAALLARFVGQSGGFFAADRQAFGQAIHLSRIVAEAMAVPGVLCVRVLALHRHGQPPNGEIASGLLALAPDEIAELANDPNHPERGAIAISVEGGL
ncbi:putative baseplate assembly protein [Ideonella sp. YS5]|uniref:putative baseplate assembly protein n=1 Tax=Ideonella sp. YS5 TaxID=3453714 RepID=UPI003EEA4D1F